VSRVLGVHGIWKYSYFNNNGRSIDLATKAISADWATWLASDAVDLRVAYYAHLLHRGTPQGGIEDGPESLTPSAQDMLIDWADQLMAEPVLAQGGRTARARDAANWISRRYGTLTRRVVLAFCREVDTYLTDPVRRASVRGTVAAALARHRASVVVAHSMGSVVAYEMLWEYPEHPVDLLITVGSPLALPTVVFDRLVPSPAGGQGSRPPGVARWINVADIGDMVAIPRGGVGRQFSGVERDLDVVIDPKVFHSIRYYLSCPEVRTLIT
jgi:hypothetical protein